MNKGYNFIKKITALLVLSIAFTNFYCSKPVTDGQIKIEPANGFPKWIKDSTAQSAQTSGISFIGRNSINEKVFLIADDIGKIHHLFLKNDNSLLLAPVYFSSNVDSFLSNFPKKDFEEIVYDRNTNRVYLSIEGDNPNPKKYVGIYQLFFKGDDVFSDSVVNIKKLNISPAASFLQFIENNIGYEGLAADEHYFYLGLEGFTKDNTFADSTLIYFVDKKSLNIVKVLSTKPYGLSTVCGLYSDKNYSIYGIDRNDKVLFHFIFDTALDVNSFDSVYVHTSIPGYPQFDYVASLESITMDDEGSIYLVDDPWKTYFIPSREILSRLDNSAVNNFKHFVPIIYKFNL